MCLCEKERNRERGLLTLNNLLLTKIKNKEIFQPYFYMLFENDKRSGLLKEVDFYQEYRTKLGDVTSYNGNYKNYYNSRFKLVNK